MSAGRSEYVPHIDGLRAIAVLSVILYHLNGRLLPGGFAGVDVFFVISGFVVSGSVSRLERISFPRFLEYFYARRLFRIAPALIVCLIVTALALDMFVPPAWLSGTNQKTGLAAFFGLSNFVLATSGNDYFSPRVDYNPFTHTWSLGVEEQFYLVFPALFIFWLRGYKFASSAMVAALCAASFIWSWRLGVSNPNRAFYMLTTRFWELGAGVLLFQVLQRRAEPALPGRIAGAGAVISAVLLIIGLITARPGTTPFPGGILPVAGALGILGFLHGGEPGVLVTLMTGKPQRFIGRISYSLYLWHWPVFVLFRWTCGLQTMFPDCIALCIVFALSVASYFFVEAPPRRALKTLALPRFAAVCIGLAAAGLGYGVTTIIWSAQPALSLSTVTRHPGDWYPDGPGFAIFADGCAVKYSRVRISVGDVYVYSRIGCAGRSVFPHDVFIMGDSHAAAYLAMAKGLVLQSGTRVYLYTVGGCPYLGLLTVPNPACLPYQAASLRDMLARVKPGDIVFLPSLRVARIVDEFSFYGLPAAQAKMRGADILSGERQAAPILQRMTQTGAEVVLEAPTPMFMSPSFRCADWFDRGNPICVGGTQIGRGDFEALRAPIVAAEAALVAQNPKLRIWDPLPVLCPGRVCFQYDGQKPLFFDGDHLSAHGDAVLLPSFRGFIGAD